MIHSMGVVVLNYNDYETTIKFIKNTAEINPRIQFAIVDNCSANDSYDKIEVAVNDYPNFHLIRSEKNGGYSYGNNYGLRYLIENYAPEILVVANPDVIFTEETLNLIDAGFENKDYAVLSAVMYNTDGTVSESPYWNLSSYADDFLDCFFLTRKLAKKLKHKEHLIDHTCKIQQVEVVPGSMFAIRAEVLEKTDFLDEHTFLYCEERILGKRMKKLGYNVGIVTDAAYIHAHSVSIRSVMSSIQSWKHILQSRYYYQKEYNKVGAIRLALLKFAMWISVKEKKLFMR